jgi:N-methylhydantoinase A
LVLGYLAPDAPLAGCIELDREAALRAIERLARQLGLEPIACAQGIVRVANAEMIRALRVVTVQRGVDPRRYALLAFGGAGPLHAAQIADELGIETIVCPRASGLAALGLVVSPRRRDVQRSVFLTGDGLLTGEAIADTVAQLGEHARAELGQPDAQLDATYELRYRGQAFELAVNCGTDPEPEQLRAAFEAEHEDRHGYSAPDEQLELVTIRVSATIPGVEVELAGSGMEQQPPRTRRTATLGGRQVEFEVIRGAPPPNTPLSGPAIVELAESTLVIAPEWSGEVDGTGTIKLTRAR